MLCLFLKFNLKALILIIITFTDICTSMGETVANPCKPCKKVHKSVKN